MAIAFHDDAFIRHEVALIDAWLASLAPARAAARRRRAATSQQRPTARGGVEVAVGEDAAAIHARVAGDPFVMHRVVLAEVPAVAPSVMAEGVAMLLQPGQAGQEGS